MTFTQLTHRESLRDIEVCLCAQKDKLYHSGIRGNVSRSAVADANERRDSGASPFFAHPEMGSVRFRVQTMGRRPLPSAARVRPGAHSARHQDSRNDLTPCRMA